MDANTRTRAHVICWHYPLCRECWECLRRGPDPSWYSLVLAFPEELL